MKVRNLRLALAPMLALVMMFVAVSSSSADNPASTKASKNVASTWVMWVKHGQSQQFEDALKAHAAWRKNAGENFA